MFYCELCRVSFGWPETVAWSLGACEMCGAVGPNHDRPSRFLPIPTREALDVVNARRAAAQPVAEGG